MSIVTVPLMKRCMAEKNRVVPTFEITLPSFTMLSRMIALSCVAHAGTRCRLPGACAGCSGFDGSVRSARSRRLHRYPLRRSFYSINIDQLPRRRIVETTDCRSMRSAVNAELATRETGLVFSFILFWTIEFDGEAMRATFTSVRSENEKNDRSELSSYDSMTGIKTTGSVNRRPWNG
ncbi:hypothetical protein [Burkholderia gladioli]|uniref:hypothetical protein n=1 Tax=Burkholderia gladioli TaxID=28095 RepID=UPI00163F8B03|nr:hypothetical protein [Burkholderia gladioli]